MRIKLAWIYGMVASLLWVSGCSNTPYPGHKDTEDVIYYRAYTSPPKDLDPQRSYAQPDGMLLFQCYESLFSYDYLKRPLELIPYLAKSIPEPQITRDADGKVTEVRYSFDIQEGVMFIDDPCFPGGKGREMTVKDFEFAFKRAGDPNTNCPVFDSFKHVMGFAEYAERIAPMREAAEKRIAEERKAQGGKKVAANDVPHIDFKKLYEEAGPISGIQLTGKYSFDLVMDHAYPQILYWLAMHFIAAIPHEAVSYYYDGREEIGRGAGPQEFESRPVGTGPYYFVWEEYDPESRMALERNPNWWGSMYPERKSPAAMFPLEPGEPADVENGIWKPEWAGQPVPQIDRVEYYKEAETLPYFAKFMQGYYDRTAIPEENYNQVVAPDGNALTPEMAAKGVTLVKDAEIHISYIGFNLGDDDIGAPEKFKDPKKEAEREKYLNRNRKIRQAMSLAIDSEEYLRIFYNGLGIPAQSPIPPGLLGYDEDYKNPYRQYEPDLKRAKELLVEAGLPNGIDPDTGEPFTCTFDTGSASSRARVLWNFFIDSWKEIGINVEMAVTDFNQFQQKVEKGNYQTLYWGWLADYPDPENFLFLLYGPNSGRYGEHKPGYARMEHPEYDALFKRMETLSDEESATWEENGQTVTMSRLDIIKRMKDILAEECPWIPIYHQEDFLLGHEWAKRVKPHPITGSHFRHYIMDKELRDQRRVDWNQPIYWPVWVIIILLALVFVPATLTIRKERR